MDVTDLLDLLHVFKKKKSFNDFMNFLLFQALCNANVLMQRSLTSPLQPDKSRLV